MAIHAVITADIVNSTGLTEHTEKKLVQELQEILKPYLFEFYRGDSFQVYIGEPELALKTALMCRTVALGIDPIQDEPISDVRISIGIGETDGEVTNPLSGKGDAFLSSGRAFDELQKSEARLIIISTNPLANIGLQLISDHLNAIYKDMTVKQAEVIAELLKGHTQQDVAGKLQRSKSTIHQHVISGRWNEIETIMEHYKKIISQIS